MNEKENKQKAFDKFADDILHNFIEAIVSAAIKSYRNGTDYKLLSTKVGNTDFDICIVAKKKREDYEIITTNTV